MLTLEVAPDGLSLSRYHEESRNSPAKVSPPNPCKTLHESIHFRIYLRFPSDTLQSIKRQNIDRKLYADIHSFW